MNSEKPFNDQWIQKNLSMLNEFRKTFQWSMNSEKPFNDMSVFEESLFWLFVSNVSFQYTLKTSENREVFSFQGYRNVALGRNRFNKFSK